MHFPFNRPVYDKAFVVSCLLAVLGWVAIYLIWKEFTTADIVCMIVTVPILAYFIHVLLLLNQR
ncbi:MAG: hypothetical protein KBF37_11640 [Saprospiraceae bacterium]|jgi:hypothetical protein|nr:hypothetical protein [Saprospiraceae bacterium]MBV6472858.1 hypothetical protein [Saprospiraceae bacterium]